MNKQTKFKTGDQIRLTKSVAGFDRGQVVTLEEWCDQTKWWWTDYYYNERRFGFAPEFSNLAELVQPDVAVQPASPDHHALRTTQTLPGLRMNDPYRHLPMVPRNACVDCAYKHGAVCQNSNTAQGWCRVEGFIYSQCSEVRLKQSTDVCPYFKRNR